MKADFLLKARKVFDGDNFAGDTLAVKDGRVLAVGNFNDLKEIKADDSYEVPEGIVIPGLIDGHAHLLPYGMFLREVDISKAKSIKELQIILKEAHEKLRGNEWLVTSSLSEDRLIEERLPTRYEIDEAVPDRPVFLRRVCLHAGLANSKALELAGIAKDTKAPLGGEIVKDAQGIPTGLLLEEAMNLVKDVMPSLSLETKKEALKLAFFEALRRGITSVRSHDIAKKGDFRQYQDIVREIQEELPLRISADFSYAALADLDDYSFGAGDEYFSLGALKVFVDGSLGAGTAWLTEPYVDREGRGIPIYARDELKRILKEGLDKGFQLAIHVIGDQALAETIGVLQESELKNLRHRLIHLQVLGTEYLPIMKELGLIAEIQPKFVTSDQVFAKERLGKERARYSYAWKTIMASGVGCSGGSDAPVEHINPFWGIYGAVTRRQLAWTGEELSQEPWHPEELLTVKEAVWLYTKGAAYAEFSEEEKGELKPGYFADFAILDKDIFAISPDLIKDTEVLATSVGGRLFWWEGRSS